MTYTYFDLSEFDSPDEPGSGHKMDQEFVALLDRARERASIPFIINSGYRTPSHNRKVKGAAGSAHMRGFAADIHVAGSRERFLIAEALLAVGINRLGIGRTFIHADLDPSKDEDVIWHYYDQI